MLCAAEWGDRSQIATITMAAELNPYGVTAGALTGHSICTGAAVLGGTSSASVIPCVELTSEHIMPPRLATL